MVIVALLTEKEEKVNSSWVIRVLMKFPDEVKRKVITKKQQLPPSNSFTMDLQFKHIDEILSTEGALLMFSDTSAPRLTRFDSRCEVAPNSTINNPIMHVL